MKVAEIMTKEVQLMDVNETIRDAAQRMSEGDMGALPVADGARLAGMVTDRDIAVRAIAKGLGPDTRLGDVMSPLIVYCYEDEDIDQIAKNMAQVQVRRVPVISRDRKLVGIVSLGDLATRSDGSPAGAALEGVSRSQDRMVR